MRMRNQPYEDRDEAGVCLAQEMEDLRGTKDAVVLGLCRGGVPVARRVALALDLPLDVLVVRKLPAPGNPELAMGAIAEGGAEVLNEDVLRWIPNRDSALEKARTIEHAELNRRAQLYREAGPRVTLEGQHAIIIDDGAATGATARAAIASARLSGASRITLGLPVAPPETCGELEKDADEVRCPWTPAYFVSVGAYYRQFPQVDDTLVRKALAPRPRQIGRQREVQPG